jgi:hypothetical protein
MPPPSDKGKFLVTIYLITIYHGPQSGRDRIAVTLHAAAAVTTSPCFQSEFRRLCRKLEVEMRKGFLLSFYVARISNCSTSDCVGLCAYLACRFRIM